MPRRIALISIGVLVVTAAWLLHSPHVSNKEAILKPLAAGPRMTRKLSGPLSASLQVQGQAPENIGDVFTVEGRIESSEDLDEATVVWVLPPTVELVSGALHASLNHLRAGEPTTVSIIAKVVRPMNQQIHLQVSAAKGGIRFGAVSQYNSRPPERDFMTKEDRLKAGMPATSSEESQKVFQ